MKNSRICRPRKKLRPDAQGSDLSRNGSSTPSSCSAVKLDRATQMAREPSLKVCLASTMTEGCPYLASVSAATMPIGPAPTMVTGARIASPSRAGASNSG